MNIMTIMMESPAEMIVEELEQYMQKGYTPREVLKACASLILPKWFFVTIPAMGFLYLFISLIHYLSNDMASAMASLGPMFTAFYISNYIKNKNT